MRGREGDDEVVSRRLGADGERYLLRVGRVAVVAAEQFGDAELAGGIAGGVEPGETVGVGKHDHRLRGRIVPHALS